MIILIIITMINGQQARRKHGANDELRVLGIIKETTRCVLSQHGVPRVSDGVTACRYEGLLRMYCASSRGQLTRVGTPAWELDKLLTILTIKTYGVKETLHNASRSIQRGEIIDSLTTW